MLQILEREVPGVPTARAGAEEIPLGDASVDAVIAAQAFHWFDLDRALPEISRVLVPGGRICLVWNQRNEKIPWVRRLGALIGTQEQLRDPAQALIFSELFGFVEEREFSHWQTVDRKTIQDLVLSRSNVAVLDVEGRAAKLAEVLAFYDDYGRGMDGMQLPYVTRCFVATALDRPSGEQEDDGEPGATDESGKRPDGPDDELLIDFR
jgi:SAM-dependent methyltransferase